MDDGKKEKAAALLATSGNRFADGPPAVFFNRLQNRLAGRKTNNWQIALLLPFSGENGVIGKAIEKGARLVVDAYNKQHEKKITLKKYDYKGQLITALEHIRAIADDPNTLLVFGPLENDISAACAAVSAYEGLTMVSPTATEPAITRLSAHSVLLSPTLETRARVLASFAADSLHLKRLAALTPLDDYFIRMEETFKKTLMAHAATLSAEEWYVPGDQSFKKQFRILKRIGLKMSFADSVRTIDSTLTDHAVDSLYRVYRKARLEELKETKTKVDSVDIPVHAFDGMFLPVYKEDIGLMAAQYAFANFQTQVLGNADWYDLRALKKSRNYINGLVFVSDGYLNEDDWNYRRFRNRFREQFKETPDLYALIAYDSFSFLTRVFSDESAVTRATITEALTRQPLYQGIYRRFHIDGSRGNRAVNILKYVYGQLIPLK
ncbi:MAG: amino acid ABC transporter substrate-binding protein [Calditrichaeota bacterium]|nr:MAG: amino acid ABC transporter substrate-binding protein [Calditrichota bacterium]